jgi:hypothetical protein
MTFTIANWQPAGGQAKRGLSPQIFTYATLDAHTTVDGSGYFNLGSPYGGVYHEVEKGDIIYVAVWSGAIGAGGNPLTYGPHLVMTKSAGNVDVSNVTTGTVTNSD